MLQKLNSSVYFGQKLSRLLRHTKPNIQHDMTNVFEISNESVNTAVKLLEKGEVIAVPTDTIYGLAVDSRNCDAIHQLYDIKGRHFEKPVAICVGNVKDISIWGNIADIPQGLLENLLPGPVTVILRRTNATSLKLNPGVNKVGIRVPDSSFVRDIAIKFGFAIALTSANVSNSHSTLNPNEFKSLWPRLGAVFDGGTLSFSDSSRAGSTIVDLSEPGIYKIVRGGCALDNTLSILNAFSLKESR